MTFFIYLAVVILIWIMSGKENIDQFSINQVLLFMTFLIIGMLYDIKDAIKGLKK